MFLHQLCFSFASGNGIGSASRGSSFKTALAGAALGTIGGLAAFEIGKAIISSPSTPFHNNNRDYYWDQQYHQQKPGEMRCTMPLSNLIQNVPTETTTASSGATTIAPGASTTPDPNTLLSQVCFTSFLKLPPLLFCFSFNLLMVHAPKKLFGVANKDLKFVVEQIVVLLLHLFNKTTILVVRHPRVEVEVVFLESSLGNFFCLSLP